MKDFFREILVTVLLAAVSFFVLQTAIQTFIVVGSSMEPSFHSGQRILVNKAIYYLHEPERGDVIVFKPLDNERADYIKRVIALPGDTVEITMETVYINDSKLAEPYIKAPPSYTLDKQKMPANNYFVLGDNRNNSNDSHNSWLVPRQHIIGKAWLSIWPPEKWGLTPNYSSQEQLASAVSN